MPFINKSDIVAAMYDDELNVITRKNETVIATAINIAIAETKLYLSDRFNTDIIFSQLGEARNAMLVGICTDIAIYKLIAASAAGQSWQDRKDRYDRAIAVLKMIQKAEIVADLPCKVVATTTSSKNGSVNIISEPKRKNSFL
jgi:phage gp36-like protein